MEDAIENGKCPVCGSACGNSARNSLKDTLSFFCPNCGEFTVTGEACVELQYCREEVKAVVANTIWRNQKKDCPPFITSDLVESVRKDYPNGLTTAEQLVRLILYFGGRDQYSLQVEANTDENLRAKVGTHDPANLARLRVLLEEADLVVHGKSPARACLTMKGWQRYAELQNAQANIRIAFMAMPFRRGTYAYEEDGKRIERDYDVRPVYEVFKISAARAGFILSNPLLDSPEPGLITHRLMVEIRRSRFLVADLT